MSPELSGELESLVRALPAEQRQEFLGLVVAETERLSRLVNQVLDMAKIESGHAEWHSADVDLKALVEHAAMTTREMFRERGAALELDLPEAVELNLVIRELLDAGVQLHGFVSAGGAHEGIFL